MIQMAKMSAHPTIDFAAEELKKYLRMMLPRCGEIPILFQPGAARGFRLGLMADFGLDTADADDLKLDDIVYIQADAAGGIIAGSNPGALLIAVYRYLRFAGCRWLFPGIDGERIPLIEALPQVRYRKKADFRYRGQCNEGAEFQQNMLETIDFTPKIGMNTYMLDFDIPACYYQRYYNHDCNHAREPEPVSHATILQWKRQCEVEIQKRGLHLHDMGHGWTAEPFGISSTNGWKQTDESSLPPESAVYLAQIEGERKFYGGIPLNTNICMSNPRAREIVADYVAAYAEKQNNVDFLHIWLADNHNNHCECAACRKKDVSDWYVILLNDIDRKLTERQLDTHLVFIAYYDTMWPPRAEKLANPKRFTMLFAPIGRHYTESYHTEARLDQLKPYRRNQNIMPEMADGLGYLQEWKKHWAGDCFCYEYHFWLTQYRDPSGMYLARLLHQDITGLKKHGLGGIVEDGSQRSFFPTGFPYYVYGETLFDAAVSYEALQEDYFSHAFGENWRAVVDYLERLRDCFDFAYLSGLRSADEAKGRFYNPAAAVKLRQVKEITAGFRKVVAANKNQQYRACTVAWRLLEAHTDFADALADMAAQKAEGDQEGMQRRAGRFQKEFSEKEIYLERYYDHYLFWQAYRKFLKS